MIRGIIFIIDTLIQLFLILLSYVVPKEKGFILFSSSDGINFKDNPKYLFLYLIRNRTGFSPCWATKNRDLFMDFKSKNLPVTFIYSLCHFFKALRAEIVVCDDTENPALYNSMFWFLGRFKNLLTWHGTGFKNIGLMDDKYSRESYPFKKILFFLRKRIYQNYFFIIATSDKDKERKILCFQNKNVNVTGSPRNDIFFNIKDNSYFKVKYNLKQYNRIIIYAPTFRENNYYKSFSEDFYIKLQDYLKETNSVFIIKKHRYDKALIVSDNYPNIIDLSAMVSDVQELMSIADILISDYSSIVSDFVLTGRPMLFYIYDYEEYMESCRSFTYDFKKTLPGPFVYNEKNLLNKIKNTDWFNNPGYQKKYMKFKNEFQRYSDGRSSERVASLLKDIHGQ